MSKVDDVRALFVPGQYVRCVDNTYHDRHHGRIFKVGKVGKTVWYPENQYSFRGTLPTRVCDVVSVDDSQATWRIGRDDHTVTYERLPSC